MTSTLKWRRGSAQHDLREGTVVGATLGRYSNVHWDFVCRDLGWIIGK